MKVSALMLAAALLASGILIEAPQEASAGTSSTASQTAKNSDEAAPIPSRQRIEEIQSALNRSGAKLRVNGVWGPETSQALRRFQKEHGLQVNGRVDEETAQQLKLPQSSS